MALPAQNRLRLVQSDGVGRSVETGRDPLRPALDDGEVVAAMLAGDAAACAAIHDRIRPQVDRTLRRLLGAQDPELRDLSQAALLEVVRSIHRYRADCSLDAWVGSVAAHLAYHHVRRCKTERKYFAPSNESIEESCEHTSAPSRLLSDRRLGVREALLRVRELLAQLEPQKAWTFLLHDVEGYDLREIAQITEVSVAAAQGRLSRGRRELMALVDADPELRKLLEDLGVRDG